MGCLQPAAVHASRGKGLQRSGAAVVRRGLHLLYIHVLDRNRLDAPLLGLALVRSFFQAWPDTFRLDRTLALIGSTLLIQGVRDSLPLQDLAARWQDGFDAFIACRQRHLLY